MIKYIFLLLLPLSVMAHDNHEHDTNQTNVINHTLTRGVASAIASGQCMFDYSSSLQGCIAVGSFDDEYALAGGLGKRIGKILFSGTISIESGEVGAGAAMNFRFP